MNKFRLNKYHLLLGLILLIGIFFRTYQVVERFEFAHDGDLYSWIVKDIVINHHFRLVGQQTTATGIFIGPLYYYLLIPFFWLTNMEPTGAIIPITIISILTIFSYFWVFKKLFNPTLGLIVSFLYSVLLANVQIDRRVVPSTPTNLWVIWYFFVIINLARGNFAVLPVLAILIALIWHIHIALAPPLLAVPIAIYLSKKLPTKKQLVTFLITLLLFSLPLIIFELKHGLSQTISFIDNLKVNQGGGVGLDKFKFLSLKINLNLISVFFAPQSPIFLKNYPIMAAMLLSSILLIKRRLLAKAEILSLVAWIAGVFIFYTFSSTIISEYYLTNIEIIFLLIVSFWLYLLFKSSRAGRFLIIFLLAIILIKNLYSFVNTYYYHKGYLEKKGIVLSIKQDADQKGFPCVAVSYITTPGENTGFRYLFWLGHLHVNQPPSGSPTYTIVLPDELAQGAIFKKFGHIGLILPEHIPPQEQITQSCSGQDSNLTDPLLGLTE